MCATPPGDGTGFARGLEEVRTGRRTLLRAGGAGLLFSTAAAATTASGPALAAAGKGTRKRAYVLVVDG